jgi:hypothetical protein
MGAVIDRMACMRKWARLKSSRRTLPEGEDGMGTRRPGDDGDQIDQLVTGLIRDADSDEIVFPEMAPVIEAGGGISEGFELSEAQLIENAEDAPLDATQRVLDDAPDVEAEPDRAIYGEADHEHSSEDDED